jgi:Family of unknown function (DUF6282)
MSSIMESQSRINAVKQFGILVFSLTLGAVLLATAQQNPPVTQRASDTKLLEGVIDIHAHFMPDVTTRSIDALDGARIAKENGMRAIVLKNHYESTSAQAYLVRKAVPGIEVFGGITLNLSVGGMNPAAVERMAQMTGKNGRMVWMDSFDSQAQVRMEKIPRPFVAVSKNGELLPETKAVIAMIAKYHLAMSTGHNTPQEDLMLIREGKRQGVEQIVVTHAMMAPIHMSISQMKEAASLGAYIEFVYNGTIGRFKEFDLVDYVKAIRAVGPAHCILATDLGQSGNLIPTEGLIAYFAGLRKLGITQAEIDQMSKVNPARVLGLN